jgi:hypothetical protein
LLFVTAWIVLARAGGLALFWKLGVDLEVVYANKYAIVSLVYFDPSDNVWMLITVHGPPYLTKRKKFWESMEEVISTFSGHWLIIGDLNSTTANSDKVGAIKMERVHLDTFGILLLMLELLIWGSLAQNLPRLINELAGLISVFV